MVTSKILNPRKIEENKRKLRNIGFQADMLIVFKFFSTTSLSVHYEHLTAFQDKSSLKLSPVEWG